MKPVEIAGIELGENEEVKVQVERHPCGLLSIVVGTLLAAALIIILWIVIVSFKSEMLPLSDETKSLISLVAVVLLIMTMVIGIMGVTIYRNNIFVVTSQKVIQQTSTGIFDKTVQTIDLPAIEDVSFRKQGFLQSVLDYGSIRLATVGDETTYQFNFVLDPERQVRMISSIVHTAKERNSAK
jgi:membrane protein YdbS with pleckstrin-like domain